MAFAIAAAHFLGEELDSYLVDYKEQVTSFSAGVSITYIFVQLMPEFHRLARDSGELIFIFPMIGFSSIHLLEKYVAKSGLARERMREDYGEIHTVFLFMYHGAIGYLIASLIAENAVSGLLFFLPIFLHVAVSSLSITELHESFFRRNSVKLLVSLAPVIGVLIHRFVEVADGYFNPVFGTVIGMFFYVVIRDSMPKADRGQPLEYIAGTLIYLAVIIAANAL